MKRVLTVIGIFWVILWQQGVAMSAKIKAAERCTVEYRFFNPSLGPLEGERAFRVVLHGDRVLEIVDLGSGSAADPARGTPGLRIVREVFFGNAEGKYRVIRDGDGRPKRIEPLSAATGASYRIDILRQNCLR